MRGPPDTLQSDKLPADHQVIVEPPGEPDVDEKDDVPENAEDLLESYGWMADEPQFDEEYIERIEEEDYLEQCFEDMWKEEEQWVTFEPGQSERNEAIQENLEGSFDKLDVADNPNPPPRSPDLSTSNNHQNNNNDDGIQQLSQP